MHKRPTLLPYLLATTLMAVAACAPAATPAPVAPTGAQTSPGPVPPAAVNDPDWANNPKLSPPLKLEMMAKPDQPLEITVTFARAMSRAEVGALGLTGEGTMVDGYITRAEVLRLVATPDVARISYRPPHYAN